MIKIGLNRTKNLGLLSLMLIFISFASCKKNDDEEGVRIVTVQLTGGAEVPAVTTTGSGNAVISYNEITKMITYNVSWTLGSSTATTTNMHFHGADDGSPLVSSGVQIGITGFTTANAGTLQGTTVALTDAQVNQLLNGKWYINIHSSTNTNGELRGNIIFPSN